MLNAPPKRRYVRCTAADIDQRYTEILFVVAQEATRGDCSSTISLMSSPTRLIDLTTFEWSDGAGHDVNLGLETNARHSHRIPDAVLFIDHIVLRKGMENLPVQRDCNGLGRFEGTFHIVPLHLATLDGYNPEAVLPSDMTPGDAGIDGADFASEVRSAFPRLS